MVLFVGVAGVYYNNIGVIGIMGLATITYFAGYIILKQEHRK